VASLLISLIYIACLIERIMGGEGQKCSYGAITGSQSKKCREVITLVQKYDVL
jgi:hypothetical protein